jgi:hypothetical protein
VFCFVCAAATSHSCAQCCRFVCKRHLREWLGLTHCRRCHTNMIAGTVAATVTAGVIVWYLLR